MKYNVGDKVWWKNRQVVVLDIESKNKKTYETSYDLYDSELTYTYRGVRETSIRLSKDDEVIQNM